MLQLYRVPQDMGSYGSLVCALYLLLLYGRGEGATTVISSPSTDSFLTGDNITLIISYNSPNVVTISWTFNTLLVASWFNTGSSISFLNNIQIIGNGSLLVTNTSKSNAGNYTVTANIGGEPYVTRNFPVTFYDAVTNVTVVQSPQAVNEGTPLVNLTCNASSGIQMVTWEKDGQSVGYNDSYVLLNGNQTLQINHPNMTSAGNYSCNVSNPVSWDYTFYVLNVSYSAKPASLTAGAIAGIVIGSILGAILLIALILLLVLCIRKRKNVEEKKKKSAAGPPHKEVIRTVSGTTLSPDDPAYFTLNNIMYRNSSISMGSYIMNASDYTSKNNNDPSPTPSSPPRIKHATQV
ncbi:carcinoembryonic antigen-related cell adhesion molecule 1-like [Pseudophryne corroboree]|uniref:carcinoembryonic antigen-related cell adhesion molecule 1-like n=1 Tax=Pseudophryne corroboree TaxID=495146 RepID=UPI003081DD7D